MNAVIRQAAGRLGEAPAATGGATPSAELGEAQQPVRGIGVQFYQYPKSKYSPEAKAQGEALNTAEQRHATRLLAPGVPNIERVAGSAREAAMAIVTVMKRQRGGGSPPWLSFAVLDPKTKGTNAEKWLEIPRGEIRGADGKVTKVISEVDRVKEFVAKVNAGADFHETLRAFNGGQNPIDSSHFGAPTSQRDLAPFNLDS
jgi:hypothetical protein